MGTTGTKHTSSVCVFLKWVPRYQVCPVLGVGERFMGTTGTSNTSSVSVFL